MEQYSVTVAANSRMLCKRADVKAQLDIATSDTSEDTRIDAIIAAASEEIRNLLGREPWLQTYSEKRPGQGGITLRLKHWPLLGSPASVTFGTGSSPATVTASTYSVGGTGRRDRLFRTSLWSASEIIAGAPVYGSQQPEYNVTYTAGWVMPDEITEWSATLSVAAGQWISATVKATGSVIHDEPFIFKAVGAGTTGSSEPTWPTVSAGTVTDNDIVFTAYDQRLPRILEWLCQVDTQSFFEDGLPPEGIKSEGGDSYRIEYGGVPSFVRKSIIETYK